MYKRVEIVANRPPPGRVSAVKRVGRKTHLRTSDTPTIDDHDND